MINSTQQAIEEFGKVTAKTKSLFGNLTLQQLNWKPSPDKWSIAQCLHHLIVANSTYYPQVNEIIKGNQKNSFYQNIQFISRFFGNYLVTETGPVINRPMKTVPPFTPSQSDLPVTIVADFEKHQQDFSLLVQQLSKVDLDKTVITSPALSIITYNLRDMLTILTGHEQRHLNQAKNVLHHPNFPN